MTFGSTAEASGHGLEVQTLGTRLVFTEYKAQPRPTIFPERDSMAWLGPTPPEAPGSLGEMATMQQTRLPISMTYGNTAEENGLGSVAPTLEARTLPLAVTEFLRQEIRLVPAL